jgi:cytochrome c biogenesis protein CcmG/thiol:disulfide interchange protein DsbE
MRRFAVILPVALFAALLGVMVALLTDGDRNNDPSRLPSPLVGKPAPAISLPAIAKNIPGGFSTDDLKGHVTIVNVFASCAYPA